MGDTNDPTNNGGDATGTPTPADPTVVQGGDVTGGASLGSPAPTGGTPSPAPEQPVSGGDMGTPMGPAPVAEEPKPEEGGAGDGSNTGGQAPV